MILTQPERVGHLLRRAGFGAPPATVDTWVAQGLDATIEALLTVPNEPETIAPPAWKEPYDPTKWVDVQAYWIHRMVSSAYPLVEKTTLFWHGHFATGSKKVGKLDLMWTQNQLLRRHAMGAFPTLLREIGKDGAMLIWLDGNRSNRRSPNENYAREVMELFTTGPGAYTEQDIKEAAKAFTGWRVDGKTLSVSFNAKAFNPDTKTVLGRTGPFKADDVADILSARPETARFLSTKLWRFFASPTPDPATVDAMARAYLDSAGEIRPVLRTLFRSEAFYDEAVMGSQVKSPVEFVAGTHRVLELPVMRDAASSATRMGQTLFDPPNVAGWPGGPTWLGASTLLNRWNAGEGIKARLGQRPDPRFAVKASAPADLLRFWFDYLGIIRPSEMTRAALAQLIGPTLPADARQQWELTRNLVRSIIASPEYQAL